MSNILEMRGIEKSFPGVKALNNVNLAVREGEIHAIVGENGAGKSTLMKVLSGVYPHGSYSGDIVYKGEVRAFKDIRDSEHLGIIIIHQELALVPLLSVMENLFLGNEQARGGVIDWEQSYVRAKELLAKVGLKESPLTKVGDLGVGKQQLIEIAKALSKEVKLLILDEPTASLNESDSDALLELLLELKRQGIASILISHKLNEISKVADSITVLRDGTTVDTFDCRAEPISEDRIIQHMVGREMADRYPQRDPKIGDVIFEVRDWRVHHPLHSDRLAIKDVNMTVRAGEIVGIAGLMGAGRTELAKSIFGRAYGKKITGQAFLHGKEVDLSTIEKAIDKGIAYVTEDRKGDGLVLEEDIKKNISLANLGGVSERTVIDEAREYKIAADFKQQMRIRCSSVLQKVVNLSGGNQQKVVLASWLATDPGMLILDEPTRGIDVRAKQEIMDFVIAMCRKGMSILFISSEIPEVLRCSDRMLVLRDRRACGEYRRGELDEQSVLQVIAGEAA